MYCYSFPYNVRKNVVSEWIQNLNDIVDVVPQRFIYQFLWNQIRWANGSERWLTKSVLVNVIVLVIVKDPFGIRDVIKCRE